MLSQNEFIIESKGDLDDFARGFAASLSPGQIVALSGDLGAGKTTLVAHICRHLDVLDDVSSPTFSIVNTYLTRDGHEIHHIDLYRLDSLEEAMNMGIEEYLDSDAILFLEWPEVISHLYPTDLVHLKLLHVDKQRRKIVVL